MRLPTAGLRQRIAGELRRRATGEDGFTMLFALLALFVGSLLVAAAFSAANGDVKLTKQANLEARAYYAAVAGVERYQYQLTANPNYWVECPSRTSTTVPGTSDEKFTYKTLGSSTSATGCVASKQTTILESSGNANGTFRVLSTGSVEYGSKKVERKIVATFAHPGFTKYVYESNYELEDPANFEPEPTYCEHYYGYRSTHENSKREKLTEACPPIEFAPEDAVRGPMHTNDAAAVCGEGTKKPTFGRNSEDSIEMVEGHYAYPGCSNSANIVGKYTEGGGTLLPPETDAELLESAGAKFTGRTVIKLKSGTPNTMEVTVLEGGKAVTTTKSFPTNGVVYVQNSSTGCGIKYNPFNTDTENDGGCGNVYVSGEYTESLTIASANDVIINGSIKTSAESSGEPTGGATLGLIAENFVRIYHPVKHSYEVENYTPKTAPASGETCSATSTVKISGSITNSSAKVTGLSSTEELAPGDAVTGSGIPPGTKIKTVESNGTSLLLTSNATSTKTTELTFTLPYVYYKGIKLCVEETKVGYTFRESETLDTKACESKTKYVGEAICEYEEMNEERCTSKATNQNSTEDPNKWGYLENPTIDAAILSTKHSFIVDNWKCGSKLGKLTVWGSIAQFWRGPVGTGGGTGGSGYIKNYNYDERLASQQPPSFLNPSSTSWSLSRETAPPSEFCSNGKC
jgi:hypothetical protein